MARGKIRHDLAVERIIDVRFSETDLMGVVYHGAYFAWFDMARIDLLKKLGVDVKKGQKDMIMPVIKVSCSYIYPARFGDELIVRATPVESTVAKLTAHFRVKHKKMKRLIAKAQTVSVLTSKEGKLILRFPKGIFKE